MPLVLLLIGFFVHPPELSWRRPSHTSPQQPANWQNVFQAQYLSFANDFHRSSIDGCHTDPCTRFRHSSSVGREADAAESSEVQACTFEPCATSCWLADSTLCNICFSITQSTGALSSNRCTVTYADGAWEYPGRLNPLIIMNPWTGWQRIPVLFARMTRCCAWAHSRSLTRGLPGHWVRRAALPVHDE